MFLGSDQYVSAGSFLILCFVFICFEPGYLLVGIGNRSGRHQRQTLAAKSGHDRHDEPADPDRPPVEQAGVAVDGDLFLPGWRLRGGRRRSCRHGFVRLSCQDR